MQGLFVNYRSTVKGVWTGYRGDAERFRAHFVSFLRQLIFQRAQVSACGGRDSTDFMLIGRRRLNFNSREACE